MLIEGVNQTMADHFEPLRHKECGKHEKRLSENDILRACQTCARQFYVCDLCRSAKGINVPLSVCIKCAPAMKTVSGVLLKKDTAIIDYHKKLIKLEAEIRYFRSVDGLKRRMDNLSKTNEEYQTKLNATEDELELYKRELESARAEIDKQNEELKRKRELTKNLGSVQKTLDYSDVTIICGSQKYNSHKCILACRSEYLRDLMQKPPEKHIHTLMCKNHNENKKKDKEDTESLAPEIPAKVIKAKPGEKPQPGTKPIEKKAPTGPTNIEICDSHLESMSFLMSYIYTSDVEKLTDKNVLHLLRTAEKLSFPDLRVACLTYMYKHITKTTAVPFLIKAYEYNDKWLKNLCSKFIYEENVDLLKHQEYISFKKDDPKLALELYEGHIKEIDDLNSNFKTNISVESDISGGSITTTTTRLNLSNKSSNQSSKSDSSRNGLTFGLNTARSYNSPTLPIIRQSVNTTK